MFDFFDKLSLFCAFPRLLVYFVQVKQCRSDKRGNAYANHTIEAYLFLPSDQAERHFFFLFLSPDLRSVRMAEGKEPTRGAVAEEVVGDVF